jgi:hypothetical protein
MRPSNQNCSHEIQKLCKFCLKYVCKVCDGYVSYARHGTYCIICQKSLEGDLEHIDVKRRVQLIQDLRSDLWNTSRFERTVSGWQEKQCFLLQKFKCCSFECTSRDIVNLIDYKLFKNPKTYKFISDYYSRYVDLLPWRSFGIRR